jgi:hypothetical protein
VRAGADRHRGQERRRQYRRSGPDCARYTQVVAAASALLDNQVVCRASRRFARVHGGSREKCPESQTGVRGRSVPRSVCYDHRTMRGASTSTGRSSRPIRPSCGLRSRIRLRRGRLRDDAHYNRVPFSMTATCGGCASSSSASSDVPFDDATMLGWIDQTVEAGGPMEEAYVRVLHSARRRRPQLRSQIDPAADDGRHRQAVRGVSRARVQRRHRIALVDLLRNHPKSDEPIIKSNKCFDKYAPTMTMIRLSHRRRGRVIDELGRVVQACRSSTSSLSASVLGRSADVRRKGYSWHHARHRSSRG